MKLIKLTLSIFLFYNSICYASFWAKSYGSSETDGVKSVIALENGLILAGNTETGGVNGKDCLILRLDLDGNIVWQHILGGQGNDYCTSIQKIGINSIHVAGNTTSYGSGDTDVWLLELDMDGQIQSQYTYGGINKDYVSKLLPLSGGDILMAGSTSSFGSAQSDGWLIRLDNQRELIWKQRIGGEGIEWIHDIIELSTGGFILVGETSSSGHGKNDVWIIRLDDSGEIIWQKTYGGTSHDWARSVVEAEEENLIIAANTMSFGSGQADIWLLKVNSEGDIIWEKCIGGSIFDWSASILPTTDGSFLVSGGTYSVGNGNDDILTFQIDSSGNITHQQTYGGLGEDYINDCCQTNTGIVMAGRTSSVGSGDKDILVLNANNAGIIPSCRLNNTVSLSVIESRAAVNNSQFELIDIVVDISETQAVVQSGSLTVSSEFCEVQYGDLNGDKAVDIQDMAIVASYWLTYNCGICDGVDMTSDKNVEMNDLLFLLKFWLEGTE